MDMYDYQGRNRHGDLARRARAEVEGGRVDRGRSAAIWLEEAYPGAPGGPLVRCLAEARSADGLAERIRKGAAAVLSLSSFTFAHGLARVVLAEQLYRAVSLATGHPYHRE